MAELKPYLRGPWVVEPDFAGRYAKIEGYGAQAQHWFQVLDLLEKAFRAGAIDVRVRAVKP